MDQVPGPQGAGIDFGQAAADGSVFRNIIHQHLGMAHNGKQDIVEIMGNPSGQGADGFHFLGLPQLFFHPDLLGNIPFHCHKIDDFAGRIKNRGNCGIFRIKRAILFFIGHSAVPGGSGSDGLPHPGIKGVLLVPAFQNPRILPHQFPSPITGNLFKGRTYIFNGPVDICDHNAFGHLLNGGQQAFTILLHLLSIGDVPGNGKNDGLIFDFQYPGRHETGPNLPVL